MESNPSPPALFRIQLLGASVLPIHYQASREFRTSLGRPPFRTGYLTLKKTIAVLGLAVLSHSVSAVVLSYTE